MEIIESGTALPSRASLVEAAPSVTEQADFGPSHLGLSLVEKGLISEEFFQSSAMEQFNYDEATGTDALSHILIGDETGGAHHLPSLLALGVDGRTIASMISDPARPDKRQSHFRKEQKVKPDGTYKALHIAVRGQDGIEYRKLNGSTMFPNEWNTQKVLESILAASDVPGTHDPIRESYAHLAEVDGVKVTVWTDDKTGKIITGFPK